MALERDLLAVGLAPKEATVYVAVLELGAASVQAIAQRAGIVRPTTYVILERLAKKGLVSKVTGPDAKKMLFSAEDPSRLERYVEQQEREVEQRRKQLVELIPELRSAYASGEEKPRVRLFEGKEGLRVLQEEFVKAGKGPIVGMAPEDELHNLFPEEDYNQAIRSLRVKAGIHSRHIYTSSRGRPCGPVVDTALLRESRYLSPERLPIKASFAVNGPLLSVVSFRNKIIGVLIEHEDIAASFRALFERIWEIAQSASGSAGMRQDGPP